VDRKEFRARLAARPADVRFEELDHLLRLYDWELATIRGSHHVYKRSGDRLLVIPFRRPRVLAVYVRKALDATRDDE
jgi:predicted RNA binding protein YcfA (HicA-like mRNA interferase family)